MKNIIIILILSVRMTCIAQDVPKEFRNDTNLISKLKNFLFQRDIKDSIYTQAQVNEMGVFIYPLIIGKNNIGIYGFRTQSDHSRIANVFTFKNGDIIIKSVNDSILLRQFLTDNHFSNHKITIFENNIKPLRKPHKFGKDVF